MLYLHGVGHFHPENVIDNAFLESLDIGTDDAWIVERTGIRARRTVLPLDYIRSTRNADVRAAAEAALYDNAETGARAARMALARAGIGPADVGLVLAGGCCPDYAIPSEAARIADRLGIVAPAVDLSSACSTFGAHLHFVASMRPEALPDYVLVVQPENTTRVVDYADRSNAVLWGDGTAAAVLSVRHVARVSVDLTSIASNPAGWDKVVIPRLGHFDQDGRAVQTFAIKTTRDLVNGIRAQVERPERMKLVAHQANLLMLQAVCRYTEIPEERCPHNVVDFGNTGAAGAPSILSMRWDEWQAGDEIALAVVGSGLTWAAMRLRVGDEVGEQA
jgi:3-oxoacyl-[acyl-carrier-protein] synthase-3